MRNSPEVGHHTRNEGGMTSACYKDMKLSKANFGDDFKGVREAAWLSCQGAGLEIWRSRVQVPL